MTRNEKRILRDLLKQVVRHDRWAWVELKRQIWDLGNQSYYDAQGNFLLAAERHIKRLPSDVRGELIAEWNSARPSNPIATDNFEATYTLLALEEVIERARIAAYRTNWDSEY